jgi:hypothetical protein
MTYYAQKDNLITLIMFLAKAVLVLARATPLAIPKGTQFTPWYQLRFAKEKQRDHQNKH